jgi:hypothetical protein
MTKRCRAGTTRAASTFPRSRINPTHEDAEAALKVLKGVRLVSVRDRSRSLGGARAGADGARAPQPAVGAFRRHHRAGDGAAARRCSPTASASCPPASRAPAMKYAETDEEATKTMLAVLAEGDQVVLIDNVERPLEGDTLCACSRSEAYRQRVLGRTEMMSVPTTTLFLATGNHLVISGDLRTRALLCRLDPKVEHPEQRQFDTELREWMTSAGPARGRGLTIMRRSSPRGSSRRTTARHGAASSAGRTWCARR